MKNPKLRLLLFSKRLDGWRSFYTNTPEVLKISNFCKGGLSRATKKLLASPLL
jgi:hypothetical protein